MGLPLLCRGVHVPARPLPQCGGVARTGRGRAPRTPDHRPGRRGDGEPTRGGRVVRVHRPSRRPGVALVAQSRRDYARVGRGSGAERDPLGDGRPGGRLGTHAPRHQQESERARNSACDRAAGPRWRADAQAVFHDRAADRDAGRRGRHRRVDAQDVRAVLRKREGESRGGRRPDAVGERVRAQAVDAAAVGADGGCGFAAPQDARLAPTVGADPARHGRC